ncbi:TadE/TadG family type IV pilus assembly protein [Caballeronia cordobensis]|uniref:TadE/TadG family type IV pilus assembly protein n=1 Tax=Caballeronia cordobensis TaxID=1353886 RepID=UPI00045F014C|nr:Flp pilus assembly protein TadG [Burkholderia sp. RPE67]
MTPIRQDKARIMAIASTLRPRERLLKSDNGAIAILFAMSASMMIGSMCVSLDAIDYVMTQGRVQMALDAATLSSGANLAHYGNTPTGASLTQWQQDARAYYDANMPSGFMGFSVPSTNFTATVSGAPATGQTIKLSASGALPLLAPKILGTSSANPGNGDGSTGGGMTPDTSEVSANNAALRLPQSTLELVMVLDNTGSMRDAANGVSGATKMSGLQTAAKSLINDLLPTTGTTTGNKNYIGLVPFASTVNTTGALSSSGSWLSTVLPTYNTTGVQANAWSGCPIEPRIGTSLYPSAYAPPNPAIKTPQPLFQRYYYNVPKNGLKIVTYSSQSRYNSCTTTSATTTTDTGVSVTLGSGGSANKCNSPTGGAGTGIATQFDQYNSSGQTITQNSSCLGTSMTFLTQSNNTLITAVGKMTPSGSTIIPVGLLWGWRMLEPGWSQDSAGAGNGWISSDTSLPKPTNGTVQNLQRVMIVLTDGQNQVGAAGSIPNTLWFNGLSGVGTNSLSAPSVARPGGGDMSNALMDSSELHNGSPIDPSSGNNAGWPDDVNTFQQAVCSAIKAAGITVYAITFGASASSSGAQTNMQSCASPGNYYHAPDNTTLNNIFQQIAGNLGVLRLTQ